MGLASNWLNPLTQEGLKEKNKQLLQELLKTATEIKTTSIQKQAVSENQLPMPKPHTRSERTSEMAITVEN